MKIQTYFRYTAAYEQDICVLYNTVWKSVNDVIKCCNLYLMMETAKGFIKIWWKYRVIIVSIIV